MMIAWVKPHLTRIMEAFDTVEGEHAVMLVLAGVWILVYTPYTHDPDFVQATYASEQRYAVFMIGAGLFLIGSRMANWTRGRFLGVAGSLFLWLGFALGYMGAKPRAAEIAVYGGLVIADCWRIARGKVFDE